MKSDMKINMKEKNSNGKLSGTMTNLLFNNQKSA